MLSVMEAKQQLLQRLSDGKVHSPEDLEPCQLFSLPVLIQQLGDIGVEICVNDKGYFIPHPITLLNSNKIHALLPASISKQIDLEVLLEIDSTNQYLINNKHIKSNKTFVFSEYQSQGRGRRQRSWQTPFGNNIACSLLWNVQLTPGECNGLSLAIGVAITSALERYGILNLQLKWPNDVLWNYRKLSGVLIEFATRTSTLTQMVIGIGINLKLPATLKQENWMDIATIINQMPDRLQISALLIEETLKILSDFEQKGLDAIIQHWQALDAYYDLPVTISTPHQIIHGIAKGINRQGELLLQTDNNKVKAFMQGEVSLRTQTPLHADLNNL